MVVFQTRKAASWPFPNTPILGILTMKTHHGQGHTLFSPREGHSLDITTMDLSHQEKVTRWTSLPWIYLIRRKSPAGHHYQGSISSGEGHPLDITTRDLSHQEKVTRWTSLPGIYLIRRKSPAGHHYQGSISSGEGHPLDITTRDLSHQEKVTRWTSLPGIYLIRRRSPAGHHYHGSISSGERGLWPCDLVTHVRTSTASLCHACLTGGLLVQLTYAWGKAVKEAAKSQPVQRSERLQGHTKTTEQGPTFITNLLNSYRR
nr:uncharacterized protein LOC112428485 [Macaca nemestrina]